MKVLITSENPVKIFAVRVAFEKVFAGETIEFKGQKFPSNVSDQPKSDSETKTGAINRAKNAMKVFSDFDYFVGLEGGIEDLENEMRVFGWVAILSKVNLGTCRTVSYELPTAVAKLVRSGKELGEADDIVFGRTNSKQKMGAAGLLTKGVVNRSDIFETATTLALIPHINSKLFSKNEFKQTYKRA